MEFTVHTSKYQKDTIEVRYNCDCGCKPRVKHQRGQDTADYEHCCCGRIHFVGIDATTHLTTYLEERRNQGEDTDLTYDLGSKTVATPWGEPILVAYAVPDNPRKH